MRKELLWAGIIGITFGLIIGFGAWRVHSSISHKNKEVTKSDSSIGNNQTKITINKPENFDVVTATPGIISGITKPATWIIVSGESGDYFTKSMDDGTFSLNIDYSAGINNIKVTSVETSGSISSQQVLVVYSASFQNSLPEQNSSTNEADLNKVVALKIARAEKPPKAYIGTVTDIADSTIQIRTSDSQIQQIATNKNDVAVVNIKGTSNKNVKLADVAIGDFIIAMGYVDGNNVLDAQRILIADSPSETKISVSLAKVSANGKKTISLTPVAGGDSIMATPDKNTDIEILSKGKMKSTAMANISVSDLVILVSDITGTPAITRSMFDLGSGQ